MSPARLFTEQLFPALWLLTGLERTCTGVT